MPANDPDLQKIVTAWGTLPAHIRQAMLALARGGEVIRKTSRRSKSASVRVVSGKAIGSSWRGVHGAGGNGPIFAHERLLKFNVAVQR